MNRKSRPHTLAPRKGAVKKSASAANYQTQCLAAFLKRAKEEGVRPVDKETLDAMGEVWPEEESLDEFLAWLRKSRLEGR